MEMKENEAIHKLALAFEEYEKEMGLEAMAQVLSMSLVACAMRSEQEDVVTYQIDTDFASGSVVVSLVSKR